MFEKSEYEQHPGVLMRASVGAWGDYDNAQKLAAITDYYVAPQRRLEPDSLRFRWNFGVEQSLDSLSRVQLTLPLAQALGPDDAQRRVRCLDALFGEISAHHRRFLKARYPLFKAEAQCNAFLAAHPVDAQCIGWDLTPSTEKFWDARIFSLAGHVVDNCAR